MELSGKIIAVLEKRSGVAKATGNPWSVQSYVLETHDQYPRKMCFEVFGDDKISQFNIQPGEEVTVSFDIDAHEYQGRWYNSIRAWNVQRIDPAAAQAAAQGVQPFPAPEAAVPPTAAAPAPFPPAQPAVENSADDLPF